VVKGAMTQITVREATISLLDHLGMTTIFGNPGSTELPLFRDFPEHFRYILGLQESVVVGMADGFAQAKRNAAFVNLHSAAGLGHGLGNLFTAFKNQTPLVVTAGQQARSIMPFDPFLHAARATEFPQPYVKFAIEPARAADVPRAILRAHHMAMQPPMGPVFVSIPVDDWDQPCEPVEVTRVKGQALGDVGDVANALNSAKRPAFVVGAGLARDDAWDEVIALAESHEASVFVAPMAARCAFPEDHRCFRGFLSAFREQIVAALEGHDLILVLGAPAFTYHAEGFGPHIPVGSALFQLGDDPQTASWLPVGTAIVTNLKLALAELLRRADPPQRPASGPRPTRESVDRALFSGDLVLQQLALHRPAESVIVEEAPSHRGAMHDRLPIVCRDGFYTTASGGLGHGLPAAIGMALGSGKRVVALLGDGSAMYAIQGLWSAAQLTLPVTFLILNNQRYEALHSFGRHFGLGDLQGTDLPGLDFVQVAEGQGVPARRVSDADSIDAALEWSFGLEGPSLIEAVVP
jgi:benzoylformate decarboxylase